MIRRLAIVTMLVIAPPLAAQSDTVTTSFEVNGLKVILRRNTANDVVAANVYLLGGTQQLTPATQGIETLLLDVSERGTKRFPRSAVRQLTAALGSTVEIVPSEDWTVFGFKSVRSTFDSTFAIFADRLVEPTLDSADVELVRSRRLTNAREAENVPDPLVERLSDSVANVGHPYGFSPAGTAASLFSITRAQLRRYQTTQMVTSRMLLVVVGNVERDRLERLVQRTLGTLPRGTYVWASPKLLAHLGKTVVMRPAQLPTNYILGTYAGPAATNPDYQALRVASAVLSGRFFSEIRSRRNLSYEVDAPFFERAIGGGGVYVTTVDPNQSLTIMRTELDRLQRELIEPAGLERLVQQFITEFFLKNETNGDQATFLARAQIYQGDYRLAARFVDNLRKVKPEDVRRVARDYMKDFRWVYLGNPSSVAKSAFDLF